MVEVIPWFCNCHSTDEFIMTFIYLFIYLFIYYVDHTIGTI